MEPEWTYLLVHHISNYNRLQRTHPQIVTLEDCSVKLAQVVGYQINHMS